MKKSKHISGRPDRTMILVLFGAFSAAALALAGGASIVDPLVPVRGKEDLAAAKKDAEVHMVVPRNGHASAVFYIDPPGDGTASAGPLRHIGAREATLDLRVRYAAKPPDATLAFAKVGEGDAVSTLTAYYDTLLDDPPAERRGGVLPVWLTVSPAADAVPGTYRGLARIGELSVPVSVDVSKWVCPSPSEWTSHTGLLMSPETLALHYGAELWSEPHMKLVRSEFELAAGLGNKDLWVSVFPNNQFGQAVPLITFVQKGAKISPDLTLLEKYLRLYDSVCGPPEHFLLEVWNSNHAPARRSAVGTRVPVIVNRAVSSVPYPGEAGSEAVWPALISGLKGLFRSLGWEWDSVSLGSADDRRPSRDVVAFFRKHAPGTGWAIWTHGRGDPPPWKGVLKIAGMEVSHYEHLFCPYTGGDREDGVAGGWDLDFPEYGSARNMLPQFAPPSQYRSLPEGMTVNLGRSSKLMTRNSAGFTRLCLDFWPVKIPGKEGAKESLLLQYEDKPWNIFYRNNTRNIVEPGPRGPVATVRYEMLREGLQECEARIFIEKQLAGGKLGGSLERRARKVLSDRLRVRESDGRFKGGHVGNAVGSDDYMWSVGDSWRGSSKLLFELAGELQDGR